MTAVRVRTPGNNPETRIYCDWWNARGDTCRTLPVADWDANDARRRSKECGWRKEGKFDFCPDHRPTQEGR